MTVEGNIHLAEISMVSYNVSQWYKGVGVGKVKRYHDPICCTINSATKQMWPNGEISASDFRHESPLLPVDLEP